MCGGAILICGRAVLMCGEDVLIFRRSYRSALGGREIRSWSVLR